MRRMSASGKSKIMAVLVNAAAFIVVVAGLRAAAPIIVVLLLAIFISVVITPLYFGMQRRKIPSWLALLILIAAMIVLTVAAVVVLGKSVQEFSSNLPKYQQSLQTELSGSVEWLRAKGVQIPDDVVMKMLNTKTALTFVGNTLQAVSALLSQAFLVLLIVVFIMLEAAVLPAKLNAMTTISPAAHERMGLILDNFRQYMNLKTLVSVITGVAVGVMLALCGIDYAVLLGVLAFVLNYVPNIGSIIAAVPGIALALIQFGPGMFFVIAFGYLIINTLIGNIWEPRLMGKKMGLSPMILVISLVFWGWVLGPVGMLLSVPITMIFRLVLESIEETRDIASLLAASAPKKEAGEQPPAESDTSD